MVARRRSIVLAVAAFLSFGTAGCGGAQTPDSPEPTDGSAAGAENPCTQGAENPCAGAANPCAQPNPCATAPDPTPVGGEATKTGADPQESKLTDQDTFDVNAVLKARRGDLTSCYDNDLAIIEIPDDGFLVKAKFTIEADGSVSGAEIVESTQTFEGAEQCFLMNLATLQFPSPPEGRVIETSYPFKIKRKVSN